MRSSLLLAVVAWAAVVVRGEALGKQCADNRDCPDGAWCVAGDSEKAVQRCVAGSPCGGATQGGCPGDEVSGQLACIWRPNSACDARPSSCAEVNGELGIYKCISLDRCDQYFGDSQCSGGCNVNGKQCNDRGVCQLSSNSGNTPSFECSCQSGWNGTKCENVIDDSCLADVGQCGAHGTCLNSACSCKNGYTGEQCEIPPVDLSASGSDAQSSKNDKDDKDDDTTTDASKASADNSVGKDTGGTSTWVIIVAIIAALIVVGAILFVVFARRKRRQEEADASAFNRHDSLAVAAAASGSSSGAIGAGPPTPKGKIVIM